MAYTQEPFGLRILNNVNVNALGVTVSQLVWVFGSVVLTYADYRLLLSGDVAGRESGIVLAGMLLGAWTGKTIVGAVDAQNKRKLHPDAAPAIEAKERGKVAGAAAAVVIADRAADLKAGREERVADLVAERVTAERPARAPVEVKAEGNVTIEAQVAPVAPMPEPVGAGHQWATGDPQEGVI